MIKIEKLQELTSKNCPRSRVLHIHRSSFKSTLIEKIFDHFHLGHRTLLQTVFQFTEDVHITILTDQWINEKKKKEKAPSFDKRLKHLKEFLDKFSLSNASRLNKISNHYVYGVNGKYAQELDSIGIFSEKEMKKRAKKLNDLRKEKSLQPLKILEIPSILSLTGDSFPSVNKRKEVKNSTNERFSFSGGTLTDKLKPIIRKKKGKLVKSIDQLPSPPKYVVSIGDRVTKNLVQEGYPVSIAIIDQKVKRQRISPLRFYYKKTEKGLKLPPYFPCVNPPGKITQQAWRTLKFAFIQEFPVIVKIYGEEDLLGFLATIMAPKGTLVLYGQPPLLGEEGIVYFKVDFNEKKSAFKLLREMEEEGEDF